MCGPELNAGLINSEGTDRAMRHKIMVLGNEACGSHNVVLPVLIDLIIPSAKHYCNQDHNMAISDQRVQHPAVHGIIRRSESVRSTYKKYSL